MTRSASFKSFVGMEKEKPSKNKHEKEEEKKMKKSKSSTSISAILSRPRSSKGAKAEQAHRQNDKENQTPPSSAGMAPPPIWAQFATQGFEEPSHTTMIPLNDRHAVEEEVALYTPRDYSPSKQRNFQDYQKAALSRKAELKARPKSECIASGPTSASFAETISGREKSKIDISDQQQQSGQTADASRKMSAEEKNLNEISSSAENRKVSHDSGGSDLPMPQRGSRVMAAVAAFNGKAKYLPKVPPKDSQTAQLDPKAIESAFESLLVSLGTTKAKLWLIRPLGSQERPSKHERQDEVVGHQHQSRLRQKEQAGLRISVKYGGFFITIFKAWRWETVPD